MSTSIPVPSIRSATYWKNAAGVFRNTHMLVFAALIIALRVAVKFFRIPLAAGLFLSFDCYVNALGSLVYGPLLGLAVGAISDTLGCILAPSGPYFLPFILVEMSSSFLFGLFFWQRELSLPRVLAAKFTVNTVCNIVLTSLFVKWSYRVFYGAEKAQGYALINGARIAKSLVLFPVEAVLIALVFRATIPMLRAQKLLRGDSPLCPTRRDYWLTAMFFLLSVGLVALYVFFLKDFIAAHNIRWL